MSSGRRKSRRRPKMEAPRVKVSSRCPTTGKRGYRTKLEALDVASRASKTGPQRAYRCSCGAWHLTRSRA